ncbi:MULTISPECIES: FAD-dependent monooxygenase [Streptomyces]|uniref:FAD-dependent monooxygenase n=1 Tax=Streptomyces TaxID=1883 RepID=UPI0004CBDB4A|nr:MULTISPECIES: FAD-dependent monooxygenase [Streptomyces]
MQTVLISGAGVAGLTLAARLLRHGFAPTVVERAPGVRPGGHAIDVRGVALGVLDRMGVLEQARALRTRMRGMSLRDADGTEVWRSTERTFSSGRLDSDDIELLREDLTALLLGPAGEAEFLFGDSLTALDEHPGGVRAHFAHAAPRTFDLVAGADGLHSAVRRLTFGEERQFLRHLGAYVAVFSTDNFLGLDNWQEWLRDETATYCVYPARDNTELRATLGFTAPEPLALDRHDTEQHKRLLVDRTAHLGGATPQLHRALWTAPDFFFDPMAQVHLDRWSAGRTVLIGDAAHSASPLSGQGTSLALAGACVLADELARADGDHDTAFARYERRMRPFAALNQALATENPGGAAPEASLDKAKNALTLDAA